MNTLRTNDRVEVEEPEIQRLSAGGLEPLATLIDHLRLAPDISGDAALHGTDPVIRSPHRLGEASGMAQWLIASCIIVARLKPVPLAHRLTDAPDRSHLA